MIDLGPTFLQEEFEEAARRRAADRLKREHIRRAEEERERLEAEAKKRAQQERRIEEARKAEARRREYQRREEEARLREEDRKQHATEERAKRMREIQERFDKLRETSDVLLTGFLTAQAGNTVVWRRRYFQLMGDRMTLHRNAEVRFSYIPISYSALTSGSGNVQDSRKYRSQWHHQGHQGVGTRV